MMGANVFIGGSGRLGKAFLSANEGWEAPSHSTLDITDKKAIDRYFLIMRPKLVVHAAAVVGKHEAERDKAYTNKVNVEGTRHIAEACRRHRCRLVYVSSVAVFSGDNGPYKESDAATPSYYYGWTKLAGEQSVKMVENYVVVRTDFFTPGGFKYPTVFTDHFSSKMPVSELASALARIAASPFIGVLHVGKPRDTLYNLLKPYVPEIQGIRIDDSAMPDFPRDLSLDISLYNSWFP